MRSAKDGEIEGELLFTYEVTDGEDESFAEIFFFDYQFIYFIFFDIYL